MNDLISRQQAIDVLTERFKRVPTNAIIAKDTIENLPSAQPNLQPTCNQLATDTISRQTAVELVMKYCPDDDGAVQCDGDIRELLDELENQPSAQPERKTATWLIHKWGDDAQCSNCGKFFKDVYDMDNYDNFCRHCGSHMKGIEQHE